MTTSPATTWIATTLRDVSLSTKLWNPQREARNEFWYIDVSAVSRESYRIRAPQRVRGAEAPSRARKIVKTGDSIFATVRPTLRRVAFVGPEFDNEIASTAFCVVRPNRERAVPRFLYYLLVTDTLNEEIAKFESGASYPAVNDKDVLDRAISLPPRPEQEKIATVLWTVQRAIEVEDKLIAATQGLKQVAMRQLFMHGIHGEPQKESDIGLLPQSWRVFSIRDKAKLIAGGTPSRSVPEYWQGGTIPWVKTGEVDYCVVSETEEKITDKGLKNSAAKLLPPGSLLVAMYGQGITRGKVAMLGIEAATNQACVALLPTTDEVDSWFLYYYLASKYDELRGLSHGANQQNLNADLVGGFRFPIAARNEQKEIVSMLRVMDRKIDLHERKLATLQDLFKTLLHQLTTGEIRVAGLDIDVSEVVLH